MQGFKKSKNETRDLTTGPITSQLFWFSLPLFAGSLIQQLYNTVDLMFVGLFIGKEAAAAVGASSLMVVCILGFFIGLSIGIGVIAARAFARKEYEELSRIIHCTAALTIIGSLFFTALGLVLAPTILQWMNTPAGIMNWATAYIRVFLLSLCSIVTYNVGAGILRALGNSMSPMIYQLIGGIANVIGNYVFICWLEWGIVGSAAATACSQTLAAALVVHHICRIKMPFGLHFTKIKIYPEIAGQIFTIGIPAAIQSIVITLSNIVVQSNINILGVYSIAAFTAYYKVENFIYLPIMAIGQACSTFISQNIGAGKITRAKNGTVMSIRFGMIITLFTVAFTLLFARYLFSMFTTDPVIIDISVGIAYVICPFYFLYVLLEVLSSAIRGAGNTLPTMFIVLLNMCVIRIAILKYIMWVSPDIYSVAVVYPVTWFCTVLTLFWYYRSERWNPRKKLA